jgi:choloylglycine hydrolase
MRKATVSILSVFLAAILSCVSQMSEACTDFQLTAGDGTILVARSMEWGADMHSKLVIRPRGELRQSAAPSGAKGFSWTSKYGYVGANVYDLEAYVDGMNEKGLSFGMLWLPGYTKYQEISPDQSKSAVSVIDLGSWLLGNFATVDEVIAAIPKIQVWSAEVEGFPGIPTAHLALHDSRGKSVVIEFVGGQQKIYDNPTTVLTNAPPFDWQLINLKNYLKISPYNAEPVKIGGTVLAPPGEGSGFLGVPGDWTPPSRFVRIMAMLSFAKPADSKEQGVTLAEHVLNAVDIPKGDIREKVEGKDYCDYTQWNLIKDLTNGVIYFRSYDNLNLRALDLKKLDFNATAKTCSIPIAGGSAFQELSAIGK